MDARSVGSPFVGRAHEISVFQERLDDLRRGRGQVLTVIADPGLGKSRLVSEMRESATDLPWRRAAAAAHEDSSAHAVSRSLLSRICSPDSDRETSPDEAILERLESLGFGEQLPLIARVFGLASPSLDLGLASEAEATEAGQVAVAAVKSLIEALTRNEPAVIEIDDLHWADPSSAQLLCELLTVTERSPVMLCLIFRPERDAAIWQLRENAARYLPHRYTEIQLQPLSRDATVNLAEKLLGTTQLPDALNALLDRAAGTPLWLEELIHTLQEQGIVDGSSGQPANSSLTEVPDTLHGLIVARLDRLGEARTALQTASVIGRRFPLRVLSRIAANIALDDHLVQAQRADLVQELAAIPEREYGFKHVLVQEATYSTLLIRRRRELHGRVANALTELYPDRLEALQPTLAFHYERAEEWDKALDHSIAAAEAARAAFSNREALTHLSAAIALLDQVSRTIELRMRLLRLRAEVHNDLGSFEGARADLEAARTIAAQHQDFTAEAQIVGALAMLWAGHRDYEEGLRLAEAAVQIATHADSPHELAQAHIRVATALLNLNREASSLESLDSARTIFHALGDQDGEAQTLDLLGMASFVFGHTDAARQHSEQAIQLLQSTGNRWTEASSAIVQGISLSFLGNLEDAREWVYRALQIWTEMSSVSGIAFANSCVAEAVEPFGRFQEAFEHASEGLRIAREIDHLEWQCMGLWQIGRVYRACGMLEESTAHLRELSDVAASLQSTLWIATSHAELGATLSLQMETNEARNLLERALRLGSGIDMGTYQASVALAQLAFDDGQFQTAYEVAHRVTSHRGGLEVLGLDAARIEGLALCALGDTHQGTMVLRAALETAQSWYVAPAGWRLHLSLARALRDQGQVDQAREEAADALRLLQRTLEEITDERLRAGLAASPAMLEARDRSTDS